MSQYRQENSRKDRAYNIATAILELKSAGNNGARTKNLRSLIRSKLGLPVLEGEPHLGDLRAHGDALGKHCLKLTVVRRASERIVMFNEENVEKCKDFIENEDDKIY